MTVFALLFLICAQAPADSQSFAGGVTDAEGRPAARVELFLSNVYRAAGGRPVLSRAKSDDQGRFRIELPPEKDAGRARALLAVWAYDPKGGLAAQLFSRSAVPAEGSLQLKLGGRQSTTVRVFAPDGKPVAGARVVPVQVRVKGGIPPASSFPPPDAIADLLAATTDAAGKGEINSVRPEDVDAVWVDAAGHGRQGCELKAHADGIRSITLKPVGRLVGRIEADDPSATQGLDVLAMTIPQKSDGERTSGEGSATSNAEGRFEIAALAAGKLAVNVFPPKGSALRPKLPAGLTIEAGKTTEVSIRLEGPSRLRSIAGRVVGKDGQGVAEAAVFQSGDSPARTETVSDADGRFRLNDVVSRSTFVFARKTGYRFTGMAVAPESQNIMLTIHKTDEPPVIARKTLPPLLPRDEEVALARRLLDPYAELVLKQGGEAEKIRTLEALARIEPERVLELIEKKKVFSMPFYNGMLGLRVASGLMEESIDEALAVLEGLEDPGAKSMGCIKASFKLALQDRAKALAVLDRALLSARAAKEPGGINLLLMGQVAERFLDLGEAERGRAILREGEAIAKQLPKAGWVGYARGAFAEEFAQVDLEGALALTKDLADAREFDRHHGNIAHELGGRNPAEAERVLKMVNDAFQREQYTVRVVYRMATVDLERARRMAESLKDNGLKGYALGMMSLALAEAGKDSAKGVLESAFDSLERPSQSDAVKQPSLFHVVPIAAALLPVSERIDPKLVDEFLWRALAMRLPSGSERAANARAAQSDVQLAMMLARYDRGIARSLIEPLIKGSAQASPYVSSRGELNAAAVAIDPKWAIALVDAMPDDEDLKIQQPKNSARVAVASLLGRVGEQRHRKLQGGYLYLWLPDVEDLDPDD